MATMKIDQAGLPAGANDKARTDGLATGALVTVTSLGTGTATFKLLWVPVGDTTAVATLAPTGNPKIWTFTPTANKPGSYRIQLTENQGLATQSISRLIFGIRTPVQGLLIPALNEIADPSASLINQSAAQVSASENNEKTSATPGNIGSFDYSGWWRALHQAIIAVDGSGGGGTGDVVGPASSLVNLFALYADTTGKLIKTSNANCSIDAGGNANFGSVIAGTSLSVVNASATDSTRLFNLENAGSNVGRISFLVGNQNPEGLVTSNTGDIYLRDSTTNSRIYQLRAAGATANTPWVDIGGTGGDVFGAASSTDNAFARWDLTTGKLLQDSVAATLGDTGIATFLGVVATQGTNDATPVITGTNTGTNPGSFRILTGNRTPEATISANAGDIYVRDSGVTSAIYQLRSAGDGVNTPWVQGGDVIGPATAVDNAIARMDLTTGKLIQSSAAIIDDSGRLSAKTFNFLTLTAHGNTGTTETIDWTETYHHSMTLDSATVTLTFTAPPGFTGGLTLYAKQDATGGRLLVFPGTVKWPNGLLPTPTSTANATDIYYFTWDGTNYFGTFQAKFS